MDNNPPQQPSHPSSAQPSASKVAIPRLDRPQQQRKPPKKDQPRVARACANCRKRKAKCTGEQPQCQNCIDQHVACVYAQGRQDRLRDATDQNRELIALLKELSIRADNGDKRRIDQLLDSVSPISTVPPAPSTTARVDDDFISKPSLASPDLLGKRDRENSSSDDQSKGIQSGEAQATGSIGSNEDLDLLDEDLLRSRESRATGFVGQNSEVQWLRSLKTQMEGGKPVGKHGPPGTSATSYHQREDALHARRDKSRLNSILHVTDSTFYLDSDQLELDIMVDPYELPSPETAEKLFSYYIDTVHTSFPLIPNAFEEQFHRFFESVRQQRPHQVPEKWQAILNLILAISARYSHLAQADWQADERDHLLYMRRAIRLLGMNNTAMVISTPDLSLIQATGLLAFYYLVIGHVSRAWVMIGISLRFALSVGLHLRNEDPTAPADKKEALVCTWWSLHSTESLLSAMIGRPCVIPNKDCTVPMPNELSEESVGRSAKAEDKRPVYGDSSRTFPSKGSQAEKNSRPEIDLLPQTSFLHARIMIDLITGEALSSLYSPRLAVESWERIQMSITSLTARLDIWASSALPQSLFTPGALDVEAVSRERLLLAFYYCSARLLICRPCLCRLDRRIKDQSGESAAFNQRTANACVEAAHGITRLFPEDPNILFIYQKCPWWSIVHNIMQAMAVFLLEIAYGGIHIAETSGQLLRGVKKLLNWLRALRVTDAVAGRAYTVVMEILEHGAPHIQVDVSDILADQQADLDLSRTFEGVSKGVPMYSSYPGFSFPPNESDTQLFDIPTTNTGFESQYRQSAWHQPLSYGEFNPEPFFSMDPGLQMPSAYGNPFVSTFDQPNPLSAMFPMETSSTWDGVWPLYPQEDEHRPDG